MLSRGRSQVTDSTSKLLSFRGADQAHQRLRKSEIGKFRKIRAETVETHSGYFVYLIEQVGAVPPRFSRST